MSISISLNRDPRGVVFILDIPYLIVVCLFVIEAEAKLAHCAGERAFTEALWKLW